MAEKYDISLRRGCSIVIIVVVVAMAITAQNINAEDQRQEEIEIGIVDDIPESTSILDGDCLNISMRKNDWTLEEDGDLEAGRQGDLIRKVRERMDNETRRIKMSGLDLNLTHFVRVIASRSASRILKILAFARVFRQFDGLNRYTCRNAKPLLRSNLGRNATREEVEELDAYIGEAVEEAESPDVQEEDDDEDQDGRTDLRARSNVRSFLRRAVLAAFLGRRRIGNETFILFEFINKLSELGTLGRLSGHEERMERIGSHDEDGNGDREEGAGERTEESDHTGSGIHGNGNRDVMGGSSPDLGDFDPFRDPIGPNDESTEGSFSLEGYLSHLMAIYMRRSAMCAERVTHFIGKRANTTMLGTLNFTELLGTYYGQFKNYTVCHQRQWNKTLGAGNFSRRNSSDNFHKPFYFSWGRGYLRRYNNLSRCGEGEDEAILALDSVLVLKKLSKIIEIWSQAGFLTNGTYFDATCRQSTREGHKACQICPTGSARMNLRQLIEEIDSVIGMVHTSISGRVDLWSRMGRGRERGRDSSVVAENGGGIDRDGEGEEDLPRVFYSFPGLRLVENEGTISGQKCSNLELSFRILSPGETERDGVDADEPPEGGGEPEDSPSPENGEVISYDDFRALREEEFALPDVPFLSGDDDLSRLVRQDRLRIIAKDFGSDNRSLTVTIALCDSMSRRLNLCLSLDGRTRVLTNDAPNGKCWDYTIYAPAPSLQSARLGDKADSVAIFFTSRVNSADLQRCSDLFDEATLELFGNGAKCSWKKASELIVKLTWHTTLETGDTLTILPNRIGALNQRFSRYASGSIKLAAPNRIPSPVARISVLRKLSACGKMELSALRSEGGGARGLSYKWSLQSPAATANIEMTTQEENEKNSGYLTLNSAEFDSEVDYVWHLSVKNIHGLVSNVTISVRKPTVSQPKLRILARSIKPDTPVDTSKRLFLIGVASSRVDKGCPKLNVSSVEYSWSVMGASLTADIPTNRSVLKLPENTLRGNADVTITLVGTFRSQDSQLELRENISFTTSPTALIARIKGSDVITVGRGSSQLLLDCSKSRDPNMKGRATDPGLTFEWRCWEQSTNSKCVDSAIKGPSSNPVFAIEPPTLTADVEYAFTCIVSKTGLDSAEDEVIVKVIEGDPPTISLVLLEDDNGLYKPGASVMLRATVQGSGVIWVDVGGGLAGFGNFTSGMKGPYAIREYEREGAIVSLLTIRQDVLSPDTEYELQVWAWQGGQDGSATISFRVRGVVSGCQLEYSGDAEYVDTASEVSYTLRNCNTDDEAILSYQAFVAFQRNGMPVTKPLSELSDQPAITVDHFFIKSIYNTMSSNGEVSMEVGVKVCDQNEACARFTKSVTYVHENLTDSQIDEMRAQIKQKEVDGDLIGALQDATALQTAIIAKANSAHRRWDTDEAVDRVLLKKQLNLLSRIAADSALFDDNFGSVKLVTDLVTEFPVDVMSAADRVAMLDSLVSILKSYLVVGERIAQDSLDGIRLTIEDCKEGLTPRTNPEVYRKIRYLMGLTVKAMSLNLAVGERSESIGSDISTSAQATLNDETIEFQFGPSSGDVVTITGGEELEERFNADWSGCGCDSCVGSLIKLTVYRGEDFADGQSHASHVMEIQMLNPCTGDALTIVGLSRPASFSLEVQWQDGEEEPSCSFLNDTTGEWSTEGVRTLFTGSEVTCETTHTTDFVVDLVIVGESTTVVGETKTMKEVGEYSDDLKAIVGLGMGVIIGIVVGSLIVIAIVIIVLVLLMKNMNNTKMKIEPAVKA